jgi:hypothetical protein
VAYGTITTYYKRWPRTNHTEFMDLHASSVKLMRSYFVEVEKSSAMLGECTAKPLPLRKRLMLTSQGVIEHTAHLTYLTAKSVLLNAARLGYGFPN